MFQLYVHGLAVSNERRSKSRRGASDGKRSKGGIEFTEDDYLAIGEIHDLKKNVFKLLVHSLCPSIYGHDLVKAGLLLGLFGGEILNAMAMFLR